MKRTKMITLSALFSALSVVVLLLASVLNIADLSVSMLASAIIMLALVEMGQSAALMIYFTTSFLSLVFLPSKFIAAVYMVFTGLYPIIKRFFDARGRILSILLKLVYFNGSLTLAIVLSKLLFPLEVNSDKFNALFLSAYYLVANIAFWLFDLLLVRVTMLYMTRYRQRVRKFFR